MTSSDEWSTGITYVVRYASLTLMYLQTSWLLGKDIWKCFDLSKFNETCQTLGLFWNMRSQSCYILIVSCLISSIDAAVGFLEGYITKTRLRNIQIKITDNVWGCEKYLSRFDKISYDTF